jgi:hypothetical protein
MLTEDIKVFPGAVFIISSWYRTYETARRVSVFYMASLFASGFGGIVCSLKYALADKMDL